MIQIKKAMREEKKEANCLNEWIKKFPSFRESVRAISAKTELKKVTIMVGTFLKRDCTRSLLKRIIGCTYLLVVSMFMQVSATQMASEKVDATVTTFLNFDS